MDFTRLKLTVDQPIAHVQLFRPKQCNAFDFAMFKDLDAALHLLKSNRSIRAVILSGSGKDFSTGLDITSIMKNPITIGRLLFKWTPWHANLVQRIVIGWRTLPYPVICVIKGRCWGAGLQLALGADFRIAHPGSLLSVMETRWGLVPDMGGSIAMSQLAPLDQALKISMTSELIDGNTALAMHLVTELHAKPHIRAEEFARELIDKSPDALAAIKYHYNKIRHSTDSKLLANEWLNQLRMLVSPNARVAAQRNTTASKRFFSNRMWW